MEFKIEEQTPNCHVVIIDIPLEIGKVDYSFEYYDHNLKKMRSTHADFWVVNESDLTPSNFDVSVNEFKEVDNAVEHAINIYMKYLKEECKRMVSMRDNLKSL